MKIIENTTPEEGFVYEHESGKKFIYTNKFNDKWQYVSEDARQRFKEIWELKLIGCLAHTHKWAKDGKLIEIKCDDVCVDDVFETKAGILYAITRIKHNDDWCLVDEKGLSQRIEEAGINEFIGHDVKRGSLHYSHKVVAG